MSAFWSTNLTHDICKVIRQWISRISWCIAIIFSL